MHILPNISRSKRNQTMKFGQLIDSNKRNIFLKYRTQNKVEKLVLGWPTILTVGPWVTSSRSWSQTLVKIEHISGLIF